MVRGGKKEVEKNAAAVAEANPEAEERKRRKRVAFSKGILSEAPAKALTAAALSPSKIVRKHHGKDILRKSQRKNRFLFSFPGLLAPVTGGNIGELKDLGTKNPVLYLNFPQGQMKLFGTIVYPKNRYLTLQFSRGGKNVTCEDYFDTMVVFSEAWWIGNKEENPEEARLELPRELYEAHDAGYDFKGGAGAPSETKQRVSKVGLNYVEQESPKTDLEDDLSDSLNNFEDLTEVTPVRHSERTAGKRFDFAEASSADDLVGNDVDSSKGEEQESGTAIGEEQESGTDVLRDYAPGDILLCLLWLIALFTIHSIFLQLLSTIHSWLFTSSWFSETVHSCPLIVENDNEDAAASNHFSGKVELSAGSVLKQKETSHSSHSCLVQTTISTLFKKVEEKKATRKVRKFPSSKASSQNLQHGPEKETNRDERPRKKAKVIDDSKAGYKKVAKEQPKVEDDDIEEFSSTSKDSDGSDEDWAG